MDDKHAFSTVAGDNKCIISDNCVEKKEAGGRGQTGNSRKDYNAIQGDKLWSLG